METPNVRLIEKLFYKKIMLYHDLLYCFKHERESLISLDLDKLWSILKEKEEICAKINAVKQEIVAVLDLQKNQKTIELNRTMDLIPKESRAEFQNLYLRLIKLKSEIEVFRKENISFVNDSLQFLDEIIATITGANGPETTYNDKCHFSKSGSYSLLSREV